MSEFEEKKYSDAERKTAVRHSLIGWGAFIAGTLLFFAVADAILMP